MTVPKNCVIIYNCGLYHGYRKTDCEDIRMSFQLLSDSFSDNDHFEDNATNHLCSTSCNTCSINKFQDNIKLIDTETSLLIDKYIKKLEHGFIILGNLDFVGWVIIKKMILGKLKNVRKLLTKVKGLCDKKIEDGQMKFNMIIKAINFLKELFRYFP